MNSKHEVLQRLEGQHILQKQNSSLYSTDGKIGGSVVLFKEDRNVSF
ncbi:hypothetical protein [Sphingobacterium allocomposti]|nr:hypothetical protein [Sphingobacterium composti Yoo et al. 2007 non Ten et al. 2007]HLS96819.1 hypothetical protein [Sphingobacterium sp.]